MNITEILQSHARQYPDCVAITDRAGHSPRDTTFAQFEDAVANMASEMRASGLNPGDAVLIFHRMSVELYVALAAVLRGGMTAMFVDPSAGRHFIDQCCQRVMPQGFIASPKAHLLRIISPALRRIPIQWSMGTRVPLARRIDLFSGATNDRFVATCQPDTPALISFTSGSTGQPKAVVRSHGFLLAQHRAVEQNLSLTAGEIELVTMPIFVLANLASRVTSVIAQGDLRRVGEIDPVPIVDQIRSGQIERITGSPAFFERLVDYCEANAIQLPSLRKVFTGGGPVSPRLLDRIQAVSPDTLVTAVYGSTEAEPISTVTRNEFGCCGNSAVADGSGLLVGKPVPGLEVRIMRDRWGQQLGQISIDDFQRSCQAPGQPGEIVVSGDHVLDGYWQGKSDDDNKFQVDQTRWHRTGDAGYFDTAGRLWLLGRCAARVDDAHGKLYPLGVEQAAMRNRRIGSAALVSHNNRRVLAVTLRDPREEIDAGSLLESLAFAKVDSIRVVKRIPFDRRHQSKIDYPSLHRLLER